jgi:CheY-like chemotaxis protein
VTKKRTLSRSPRSRRPVRVRRSHGTKPRSTSVPAPGNAGADVIGTPNRGVPVGVAVLNSNQDVLRLIRSVLEDEGYAVSTEHIVNIKSGETNLAQFLLNHRPSVLIYDIAPPYKENWNFLQLLCDIPQIAAVPMVITTVNKAALENAVGKTTAFEIVGTRDNLAPLIAEVNRLVRALR